MRDSNGQNQKSQIAPLFSQRLDMFFASFSRQGLKVNYEESKNDKPCSSLFIGQLLTHSGLTKEKANCPCILYPDHQRPKVGRSGAVIKGRARGRPPAAGIARQPAITSCAHEKSLLKEMAKRMCLFFLSNFFRPSACWFLVKLGFRWRKITTIATKSSGEAIIFVSKSPPF